MLGIDVIILWTASILVLFFQEVIKKISLDLYNLFNKKWQTYKDYRDIDKVVFLIINETMDKEKVLSLTKIKQERFKKKDYSALEKRMEYLSEVYGVFYLRRNDLDGTHWALNNGRFLLHYGNIKDRKILNWFLKAHKLKM